MRTTRAVTLIASLTVAGLALAGCSTGGGGSTGSSGGGSQTDSGGKITVWVDPPRVPAADAFKKANPDVPINVVTINGTVGGKTTRQAFAQFDAAKKGWPDAIFFPSNDDIAWAAQTGYAADVSKAMPDVTKGYSKEVLASCDINGAYRCLRNDAAPDVLWYNAKLFKQWKYDVPTTWKQYQDLAVKIAKEHPGYISGFTGDAYAPNRYLWASDCPTNVTVDKSTVRIALNDPKCTRAKDLLTNLTSAKALSSAGIFDTDAVKDGKKLVMSPGALWWGSYLFQQTWKLPSGEMQAAGGLTWDGESKPSMGNEGGGLWGLSSHIKGKQLANAEKFMKFVTTDPAWQVELTTGLPAYGGVQQQWLDKQASSSYYADTKSTLGQFIPAIANVPTDYKYQLYDTGAVWTQYVAPALVSGKGFDAAWSGFSTNLVNQAKAAGYTVKTD
jgi:ABC-type glycerol-3-phosphate transport system substrate-binding protein